MKRADSHAHKKNRRRAVATALPLPHGDFNAKALIMEFTTLCQWAEEELKAVNRVLPTEVQQAAAGVSLSLESRPSDPELAGDELGVFEGQSIDEEADPANQPRIRLFLNNLWEWVEGDEHSYRDQVGLTYLHELGHYLGWDEEDLSQRGLE